MKPRADGPQMIPWDTEATYTAADLERAVEAEREACASLAEDVSVTMIDFNSDDKRRSRSASEMQSEIARRIRARSAKR